MSDSKITMSERELKQLLREAAIVEREACAKLCDKLAEMDAGKGNITRSMAAQECAWAIQDRRGA